MVAFTLEDFLICVSVFCVADLSLVASFLSTEIKHQIHSDVLPATFPQRDYPTSNKFGY